MTYFEAIFMGIFQGIAEFLPISSSGHLALLQSFFGIEEGNLFFAEMLHFGTLISIIVVYFNDVKKIIVEFLKLLGSITKGRQVKKINKYQKLGILIIIGSIPTAAIGLIFQDFFESIFTSILPIGIAFLVTGVLLFISEKKGYKNHKNIEKMSYLDSLLIGIAQGIAILPGISRSGTTIVAGLFRGLSKPLATEYSFLLALPATFGAGLLGIIKLFKSDQVMLINLPLVLGTLTSTIIGIVSIKVLIHILNRNKFHYFSYYLWILSIITIVSQFI